MFVPGWIIGGLIGYGLGVMTVIVIAIVYHDKGDEK